MSANPEKAKQEISYGKKYQVFVSSTYEDLKEERQAVIGALLDCGFIPVGME